MIFRVKIALLGLRDPVAGNSVLQDGIGYTRACGGAAAAPEGVISGVRGRSGIGASFSLPHLPAKVSSLNAERPLSLGGGNWPSCPTPVIGDGSWPISIRMEK